ncbi:hypothetical protein [Wohlfahrtiimonas chitiniclastica]|uniref:hypothetical protein n=1 Tax=Wohlfahrtiimonas chitiniclastica TaxID=400946 RepID=UPI00200B945B|nr:hypothetical protein [Wohlfahrtiimonas chitiniclastica]
MKSLSRLLRFFWYLFIPNNVYAIPKSVGKGYCMLRHPVEFIITKRNTSCESQHIIQRIKGGENQLNTIWINTHLHDYLDRSSCKPWKNQRPMFKLFGSKNLERGYMIGTWANGFHFVTYDHHGRGKLNLYRWDAVTHLVTGWTSLVNYPQKELNYLLYQLSLLGSGRSTQILDAILGIGIDLVELILGLIYSVLGIFIGALMHPFDTLRNLIPGALLLITGSIQAIRQLLSGLAAVLTVGKVGGCSP